MLESPPDFLESRFQDAFCWVWWELGMPLEINLQSLQLLSQYLISLLVGIGVKGSLAKFRFANKHLLLQEFTVGQTAFVFQETDVFKENVHQHAEVHATIFPVADSAIFLTVEEMVHDLYDAVGHQILFDGRVEQTAWWW